MTSPSVSLSLLVTREVPYDWHDAVALVAQLIDQLRADIPLARERVPHLGGISLAQNGTLALSVDPAQAMPGMPGAAQLLHQLLSGKDQPAALRLLVVKAISEGSTSPLDGFAAELTRWERPNRQAKLAALYRVAAAHLGLTAPADDTPLARFAAETPAPLAVALTTAPVAVSTTAPRARSRAARSSGALSRRELTILSASGAAVIGAAIWIATGQPIPFANRVQARDDRHVAQQASVPEPAPPPDQIASSDAPSELQPASMQAIDAPAAVPRGVELQPAPSTTPGRAEERSSAPSPVPSTGSTPTRTSPANRASSPGVTASTTGVTSPRADTQVARGVTGREDPMVIAAAPRNPLPTAVPSGVARAEQPTALDGTIGDLGLPASVDRAPSSRQYYRPGDPGVTPPVPLARMPRKPDPGTPASQLQVLEVHVNSDGTVETARFVDTLPSYRNRWWTSAAKSWRFRPALKNGQPVPFVLRITIEDPGGA